jgi:hypothetical protein
VFVTGSNYFVDTVFSPLERRVYINIDGEVGTTLPLANGTGSLTTTGSLFVGNLTISSSQAYSGSILNTKIYTIETSGYSNYKTLTPRISKPIPVRPAKMQVLIVAGGGGGASRGAAGAGGVRFNFINITPSTYSITVGNGGAANTQGQNSSFSDIISSGGGRGNSGNGGSGGGGNSPTTSGSGNIPATTPPQGFDGGQSFDIFGAGGGGGGASEKGYNGTSPAGGRLGGNGGAGLPFSISGITTYYGGGGGGSGYQTSNRVGTGGIGGGGSGSDIGNGQSGQPNTGGGGGASQNNTGGSGGSGIVIIRYPGPQIATGGTITSVGGDTIHTFTETGSHTFTVF